MDMIIELAKDLSYELQNDQRFIRLQMARSASDADEGLQALIGEFNLKRIALNGEMSRENVGDKEGDEGERGENSGHDEKLARLNSEVRDIYDSLMKNENMAAYQNAKNEMDKLVNQVITIITMSAQGHDPEEADSSGCGGGCSGCSGCH